MKCVLLEGSPYDQGLSHGRQLKDQIQRVIWLFRERIARVHGVLADEFIRKFLDRTDYVAAIKEHTPSLYEETEGIAVGADVEFDTVLSFQLMDEVWMNGGAVLADKCSALGVDRTRGHPAIVAQNMDIEGFRNGFQVVLRTQSPKSGIEQLVFTCAGFIATNGVNSSGIGVCVNALTELAYGWEGLPVAHMIRGLLMQPDMDAAVEFVTHVTHATGQDYLIGDRDHVRCFECSHGAVVEFPGDSASGTIAHTNHALVNEDFNAEYWRGLEEHPEGVDETSNSHVRLQTLRDMLAEHQGNVDADWVKTILRSRNGEHTICVSYTELANGFTFGSSVMVLREEPILYASPGPPNANAYREFRFG